VRDAFDVKITARGNKLILEGGEEAVKGCYRTLSGMQERVQEGEPLDPEVVSQLIGHARCPEAPRQRAQRQLESFEGGQAPRAVTEGQDRYIKKMLKDDIVFCIGPAGSGKTYLAVAVALDYLKRGELKRIVLCRPAVEAGEHLGYLPGDLRSKVNPYLRPLYDALHDLMPPRTVKDYVDSDLIEILPLAFVRGRTLDDAFIILDEAQNCTVDQMKTFLTRLGKSAKLVVTGDITQVDLPHSKRSGLVDVQDRLSGIPGIGFVRLNQADIVRHRLVKEIVNAYQREASPEAEDITDRRPRGEEQDRDHA
jgi:phosphate starvation-inducible PhoH-like protein